jgi:cytochrome P450
MDGCAPGRVLCFFPFGQGMRDCIGQGLAKLKYTATLSMLLGRFHFQLAPEVRWLGRAWLKRAL